MKPKHVGPREFDPLPSSVECPWCGSGDTGLEAPFGGMLSVAQYRCNACRTIFEYVKWETAPEKTRDGTSSPKPAR